jgi:dienelactone hydrolase
MRLALFPGKAEGGIEPGSGSVYPAPIQPMNQSPDQQPSGKRVWWTKLLWGALGVLLAAVLLLWEFKAYRDAHYFDNYAPGEPLNAAVIGTTEVNQGRPEAGYTITQFTFDGFRGERIPALISLPMSPKGNKIPAVVFLHGIGQNKNFLKEIASPFNQAGFALATFDQYTQGERKLRGRKSVLARLEAFRQRPAKTINEARRLIDYLSTRPDIDSQRIYLVGASYGAVTGTILMAKDPRIRAGVMVYGGGDLSKLADSYANHLGVAVWLGWIDGRKLNPEKPPLPKLTQSQEWRVGLVIGCIKPLVRYFLGVADPIHYVARISPRPVYFQNGKYDVLVPAAAGQALQDAAKEPKKITWYESDHVGINLEHTKRVLVDGLRWLLEQDNPCRAPEEKVTDPPQFNIDRT